MSDVWTAQLTELQKLVDHYVDGREVELKLEVPPSTVDHIARQPWLKEVSNAR